MNFRDLQYIITLAELGSMVRAAKACHVSQPALSIQLKKLEDELGVSIFDRNCKKLQLTTVGKDIVAIARQILTLTEQLKKIALLAQDPFAGEIKIGAFPTLGPYLFPIISSKIKQQLPNLTMILVEEKTKTLLTMLKSMQIDCAFIALPMADCDFMQHTIFTENFFLAVSKENKLANLKKVSQSQLSSEKILLLEEGHCLREQSLDICKQINIQEYQEFYATSLETLKQMVANNACVTFVPQLAATKHKDIVYLPFHQKSFQRTIALCWRKNYHQQPCIDKIIDLAIEAIDDLIE